MSIIDHLQCGRIIIFNSLLFKLRWAFCIDYAPYEQIIYRGLFGLKAIDKKTFLGFARIVDVFDYIDKELTKEEVSALKTVYKNGLMKTMQKCATVPMFVEKLYEKAGIKMFVSSEGWRNVIKNKK